jgi:POT family proton-dependent oligopeptide transporter
MTQAEATAFTPPAGKEILGHPRGLTYLAFAEAWERFSYYGMQALLVLYMTQQLLLPGHVENIVGFPAFRAWIEGVYGPQSPAALASLIFGFYAGGVYLTPIFGGFLADRVLGRTNTVAIGAILMAIGHFAMAFEQSFLLALSCLLLGVGCFKGNIASQVGELYAPDDLRRADAFQLYFLGIQIAVVVSPLVCGTLGQNVAWHWGFGAAGVGMLIGLAVYLAGRKYLPPERPRGAAAASAPPRHKLTARDWVTIAVLIILLPVMALSSIGNQEIFNAYLVWGDANYQLEFFGQTMPVTWLLSVDAGISFLTIGGVVIFFRWYAKRWKEPDEIIKMVIGSFIAAGAPLLLALAAMNQAATGEKASLLYGIGFHLINDIGFAMIFPVGLALYSRAAPKGLGGMIIGIYYLHLFIANNAVGYLGGLLEKMDAAQFWMLHAGLVAAGGAIMLAFALLFRRNLAPTTAA